MSDRSLFKPASVQGRVWICRYTGSQGSRSNRDSMFYHFVYRLSSTGRLPHFQASASASLKREDGGTCFCLKQDLVVRTDMIHQFGYFNRAQKGTRSNVLIAIALAVIRMLVVMLSHFLSQPLDLDPCRATCLVFYCCCLRSVGLLFPKRWKEQNCHEMLYWWSYRHSCRIDVLHLPLLPWCMGRTKAKRPYTPVLFSFP